MIHLLNMLIGVSQSWAGHSTLITKKGIKSSSISVSLLHLRFAKWRRRWMDGSKMDGRLREVEKKADERFQLVDERFQNVDRRFDKQDSEIRDYQSPTLRAPQQSLEMAASVECISPSISLKSLSLLMTLIISCGLLNLKYPNT